MMGAGNLRIAKSHERPSKLLPRTFARGEFEIREFNFSDFWFLDLDATRRSICLHSTDLHHQSLPHPAVTEGRMGIAGLWDELSEAREKKGYPDPEVSN